MDKLSLYEILSFVVPGFIFISVIEVYNTFVFGNPSFFSNGENKLEDSLLLFCLSLFIGIIIHIVTFRFLKTSKLKWYKKLIFKNVNDIVITNEFIQKAIPFLNADYRIVREHYEDEISSDKVANNLFDFAYLYLEVNDKISSAKNFQSMYFWFRNMFTICILLAPISIIILIVVYLNNYEDSQVNYSLFIAIGTLVVGLILIPTANWLREKLIEKVLWSYYVERVHQKESKK